jgi:hypothetical protein
VVTALKEMAARLRAFFRTRDLDRDCEQELESHLAMLIEDNVGRGMPPEHAHHEALAWMGDARPSRNNIGKSAGCPGSTASCRIPRASHWQTTSQCFEAVPQFLIEAHAQSLRLLRLAFRHFRGRRNHV